METTYRNNLLRVTAILFIVFSVLGLAAAAAVSLDDTFAELSPALIFCALVAAIPRFIAGVMGIWRSAAPERSGFFQAWGITLLVLGSLGMLFFGFFGVFTTLVSLGGGIVLPILYIVGAGQMKRQRAAELAAARMPGINYGALPSGSSPYAPPYTPPPSAPAYEPVMREEPSRAAYRPQSFVDAASFARQYAQEPQERGPANPMLKWASVALIVLAVLGAVAGLVAAANLWEIYLGEASLFGNIYQNSPVIRRDPDILALFDEMSGDSYVRQSMEQMFAAAGWMVGLFAVLGAVPRLVAGIMGLRRCANPEKHKFFFGWGLGLLIVGVLGLGGLMGMLIHPLLTFNSLVSIGNAIMPIFYLVGSGQMKSRWLSTMPVPTLNYDALPSGSSPYAPAPPPAPDPPATSFAPAAPEEAAKPENHGPEF